MEYHPEDKDYSKKVQLELDNQMNAEWEKEKL